LRAIPYIAFFLSGASSLIFQALWTRMLHHTFGATSVAMSTVLTAFMSGLGLGAYIFGKRAARFARPLVVYAVAELGVAACALVIPPLVRSDGFFALVNAALRHRLGEGSFAFMVARFFCVLPILLVPTTLMGGTLPLLAQHFVRPDPTERQSAQVGSLYALNTLGAVAGTVLSSFVLMPAIGVHATNLVAVAINVALGLAILALSRARGSATATSTSPADARQDNERATPPAPAALTRGQLLAVVSFALSGLCSMAYEVVWSRALAMAIGSSLQSFALILVTFLVGIAGGSGVASQLLGQAERLGARGLILLCASSWLLCLLALAPAIVLSSAPLALALLAVIAVGLGVHAHTTLSRARALAEADDDELQREATQMLDRAALRALWVPLAIALSEVLRFALKRSSVSDVALHGYLPYITAGSVVCIALSLALSTTLRRSPWLLAGAVQLGIAISTLASYAFQDEIPYSFARLVSALDDLPQHVGTVRFFMLLAAGLCTLPAALGMGAMFPITLELWSRARRSGADAQAAVGEDVGRVYAANTVGSIVGAWLPGFVLLPLWGLERTLAIGMAVNAAVALALLVYAKRAEPTRAPLRRVLVSATVVLLVALGVHGALPRSPLAWNLSHMTLGAFRVSLAREVLNPESWGQPDLVYYRDGISTTVSVERWGRHLSLKNNGKVDASNGDDMPTQIMVSAYPLLLHARGPKDLDVAIVGFGSGVTVGAALEFPVRHVDSMELEDAVVDAALRYFSDVSHLHKKHDRFPYLEVPRLSLYKDDGRNFLAATDKRYDVIVSEPSNPWITGVSDLFTVDHFQVTKKKLKPGGVYCQWVQLYELSPENIKTVYRTFASQFRYVLAFSAEELSSDTILVGSDQPLGLDLEHVAAALRDPRVATELERAFIHSPYDVWSRLLFASREELLAFTQREWRTDARGTPHEQMRASGREPCVAPGCTRKPVELNTDDNMLIELRAPADLIGYARYAGYLELFYGASWPYGDLATHLTHVDDDGKRRAMALSLLAHGRKTRAHAYLAQLGPPVGRAARIDQRTIELMLGTSEPGGAASLTREPDPQPRLAQPSPSLPMTPTLRMGFERIFGEAEQAFTAGDYAASARALERLPAPFRSLSGPDLRFRYGLALLRSAGRDLGRMKRAGNEFEALLREHEGYARAHPELYYYLARALDGARRFDKAVRNMRAYAATSVAE
jgi:spermidine synthase/MFS family permease